MYLRYRDYSRLIQDKNFQQIISDDDSLRLFAESAAIEEATSSLANKYDTGLEFTDTGIFNFGKSYGAGGRAELNFTAFDQTKVYQVGASASVGTQQYICKTLTTINTAFNAAQWQSIGNQYDLVYIPYPYPRFDFTNGNYKVGDRVWWRDKIYQCVKPTNVIDHIAYLAAESVRNIPAKNVFPDDVNYGTQYWGTGIAYSITGLYPNAAASDFAAWASITTYSKGARTSYQSKIVESIINSNLNKTPLTDITSWQSDSWIYGDNRSQQLVAVVVDITLFHLHSRIAPQNVPELRTKRYEAAQTYLRRASKGEITPNLPLTQPQTSARIRYGGQVKNINSY